jgi:hypothetical protein
MSSCPCNFDGITPNAQGIVIIGGSAEAFIYASILLRYQKDGAITVPIYILCEGVDRLAQINDLSHSNFPLKHLRDKLYFFDITKVRYSTSGTSVLSSYEPFRGYSTISELYTGWGPCGNYVFTPTMDFGPWFDSQLESGANQFLEYVTVPSPYTDAETRVTNYIQTFYCLPTYNNQHQGIFSPAVTYHHRYLRGSPTNRKGYDRNYFQEFYRLVKEASVECSANNVKLYTEVTQLAFQPASLGGGLYNLSFMAGHHKTINLTNVEIVWKTFHTTYQKLAVEGGLRPNLSHVPTSYRSVIPMSLAAAGLSEVTPDPLGITSRISFSLPDLNDESHSVLCWLIHAYTIQQDLMTDAVADTSSSDPKCLLIVEALCRGNRRKVGYNMYEKFNTVDLNSPKTEARFMCDFRTIVSVIYTAYTNLPIPEYANSGHVCDNGLCLPDRHYSSQPRSQIMPLIALNTIVSLFPRYLGFNVPSNTAFA